MAIRSLMSKLVPATDLGKIYATMGALENLVPLAVSPGFTLLYNHSLETWPGLVTILTIVNINNFVSLHIFCDCFKSLQVYLLASALVFLAFLAFAIVTRLQAAPREPLLLVDESQ